MKIICNRQKIMDAVLNVQRSVSTKSNLSVLEGILLTAKDEKLELCGYNLELGIKTCIDAKVAEPGEVVLSARIFSEIVRKLPGDDIFIDVDNKQIANIKSGLSEFSIIGISATEFPELPSITNAGNVEISGTILKSMIKQTIFAVADSEAKPIHTGTLFELEPDQINLISVDGYRLAMRKEKINNSEEMRFVVPGKTLAEILKLIPDEEKIIKISVGNRHIIFEVENYMVISRLLDGDFLDYKAAIPQQKTTSVKVSTKNFTESIERVSLLITDRLKSPLRCIFSGEEIKLSCATSLGKASDEFKAPMEGNSVEIGFNNRYILDALKNVETDEVLLHLNGALNPMKILPVEGDSFLFLVLPVRLKYE